MQEYLRIRKQGIIRERVLVSIKVLGYVLGYSITMFALIVVANIIIGLN